MLNTAVLDGHNLRDALTAGALEVIGRQDHLNKINVFPVADGDTGTNLAHTLSTIAQRLKDCADNHAGNVLTLIADAALDGARGNSGAIFAQFFQGLSDGAAGLQQLTTRQFSHAAILGAKYAHDALSEPKEGTLVTVLRDFSKELRNHVDENPLADFITVLQKGLQTAVVSLKNTPNLLEVLKKAGVVDAGAQGFVDFLSGMVAYLTVGKVPEVEIILETPAADDYIADTGDFQYCTECIIENDSIDQRILREGLSQLGNSLVIAGRRNKVRIHMHVNTPQQLFDAAAQFGSVSGQKADDMWSQAKASGNTKTQQVALVIDSSADIPDETLDALSAHVVPLRVHFGDVSYLDKVGITSDEFYIELANSDTHPTTSQPSPGDFRRLYSYLASHYEGVISLHVTSVHSGTHQSAVSAANRTDSGKVHVVDSRNGSVGLGLLAQYAGELAQKGLDLETISASIESLVDKTSVFIVLDDLRFAVRGGRIPPLVHKLSNLFRIRPVLTINSEGRISLSGVLFGKSNVVRKFSSFVQNRINPNRTYRMAVGHASSEENGKALHTSLSARIPKLTYNFLDSLGPALGVHAGPGALVVAIQEMDQVTSK